MPGTLSASAPGSHQYPWYSNFSFNTMSPLQPGRALMLRYWLPLVEIAEEILVRAEVSVSEGVGAVGEVRLAVAPEEARPDYDGGVVQSVALAFEEAADDEEAGLPGSASPGPERGV